MSPPQEETGFEGNTYSHLELVHQCLKVET